MSLNRAVMRALERFARNSKLLSLLDRDGLARLAASGTIEHREADETVVTQGDENGHTFYLIVAGTVRVFVHDTTGPREVASLDAGNFFGEIGTLTRQPRSATVVTQTPVELVVFQRAPVMELLQDYPSAREVIGRVGLARSEENIRGEGLAESLEGNDDEIGELADLLEGPE